MLEQFEDVVEDWYFHYQDRRLERFLCQGHVLKTSEQGRPCCLILTSSKRSHTHSETGSKLCCQTGVIMIRKVLHGRVYWLINENKRNWELFLSPKWVLNWFQNWVISCGTPWPGLTHNSFCLPPAECLTEVWKGDTGTDGGAGSDDTEKNKKDKGPTHDAGELWKAEQENEDNDRVTSILASVGQNSKECIFNIMGR